MKIPNNYMIDTMEGGKKNTLAGLAAWVEEHKPEEIEMVEYQFWQFTYLQPLPLEERYWNTFHAIPLRCYDMTLDQQRRLRLL